MKEKKMKMKKWFILIKKNKTKLKIIMSKKSNNPKSKKVLQQLRSILFHKKKR